MPGITTVETWAVNYRVSIMVLPWTGYNGCATSTWVCEGLCSKGRVGCTDY